MPGAIEIDLEIVDLCRISTALGLLFREIDDHPDQWPLSRGRQGELNELRHKVNSAIVREWTKEFPS